MSDEEFKLDEGFDFGFTTHPDNEFVEATIVKQANDKALAIYNAIMPLLDNLARDADKNEVIKWPNRKEKIEAFKKRLHAILTS